MEYLSFLYDEDLIKIHGKCSVGLITFIPAKRVRMMRAMQVCLFGCWATVEVEAVH